MGKRTTKRKRSQKAVRSVTTRRTASVPAEWKGVVLALVLIVIGGVVFSPAMQGGWLWDDGFYITNNPLLNDPARLWKIWFWPGSVVNYFPISASVQWAQWEWWGMETTGYHITNVVLHLIGALLVWRLLKKLGLRWGWLGGLLFAIHPSGVESVAWISELKNTLSLPPFLMAMCAWIDFEEKRNRRDYIYALIWFLVAMLCKTTMAAFPIVILLYAWWKRGRVDSRDLKASAPFFVISLVLGLLNVVVLDWYLQSTGYISNTIPIGGFFSRVACSGLAFAFYFTECFWPLGLVPAYPQWSVNPPELWQFWPWVAMAGVAWWFWTKRAGWGRHALLGLGFFVLNLAPFVGMISNSFMRFTWVMDHFLYIAIIGIIGLVVAAAEQIQGRLRPVWRPFFVGGLGVVVIALAWQSYCAAYTFRSQVALWTHTLTLYPDSWIAHENLADGLYAEGKVSPAVVEYREAARLNPHFPDARCNIGNLLCLGGHFTAALEQYRIALQIDPKNVIVHNALGNTLVRLDRFPEAKVQYAEAVRLDPHYAIARTNLANVLSQEGNETEALRQYEMAVRINPGFAEGHYNLALALGRAGRIPEAVAQLHETLKLNPQHANAIKTLNRVKEEGSNSH